LGCDEPIYAEFVPRDEKSQRKRVVQIAISVLLSLVITGPLFVGVGLWNLVFNLCRY
jgi:hypothetical protein